MGQQIYPLEYERTLLGVTRSLGQSKGPTHPPNSSQIQAGLGFPRDSSQPCLTMWFFFSFLPGSE